MLMSANERGINLQAENDLGEGLPSYQVAIGERSETDRFKINKEDSNGNSEGNIQDIKIYGSNSDTLALSKAETISDNKHIVPSNNNTTKHCKTGAPNSALESNLKDLKDIPNSNESQDILSNISTKNLVPEPKKEPTTYIISNTRSCTLQLKSSGFVEIGSKKNKVCFKE